MPVYSFTCNGCGEEFTRLVKTVKEKNQIKCPHCGSENLKQLFRPFNYVRITQKYHPGCNNAANCTSAKRFGCGKYASNPVPPIIE